MEKHQKITPSWRVETPSTAFVVSPLEPYILLMEEILDHLGCIIPANNGMITISTGAGFLPSTVAQVSNPRFLHRFRSSSPSTLALPAGKRLQNKMSEPPEIISKKTLWCSSYLVGGCEISELERRCCLFIFI